MKKTINIRGMVLGCVVVVLVVGLWMITASPEYGSNGISYQIDVQPDKLISQIQTSNSAPSVSSSQTTKFQNTQQQTASDEDQDEKSKIDTTKAIQTGYRILDQFKQTQAYFAQKPSQAMRGFPRGRGQMVANPEQQKAIDGLLEKLGEGAHLQMDNVSRTLRYLQGDLERIVENSMNYQNARNRQDFENMSIALAQEIQTVLNIQNPSEEFFAEKIVEDELGMTHVVLQQQYRGVPVWGAEIGVHYNRNEEPVQISGVYTPTPFWIGDQQTEIDQKTALSNAKETLKMSNNGLVTPAVERIVYWDHDRAPVMCYGVQLTPNLRESWFIFVSTTDGRIVHRYNQAVAAAAVGHAPDLTGEVRAIQCWEESGQYYAIDTIQPMYDAAASNPPKLDQLRGAIFVMDLQDQVFGGEMTVYTVATPDLNQWDATAVSLMRNFALTEDYYRETFQRNSINDEGLNIWGMIHPRFTLPDGSQTTDNAFWNPGLKGMVFGDGDSEYGGILPHSLDIVAHEYTHGITNFTANLIYEFQSGALNEHLSDFFGCMVDREDWLMGEEVVSVAGKIAVRDMENPGNPNVTSPLPSHMSEFVNWPIERDQGGVHINCGIPNRASFLLAAGPNGIGRDKTEDIVHRAQTLYLRQRSQFVDYRRAVISAAVDLFGENSPEVQTAKSAFDEVGILDGGEVNEPTPGKPTEGTDAVLFLAADPSAGVDPVREDYYYQLLIHVNGENRLLAPRYVANTRPAMSGDGMWGMYVDAMNNIYASDGEEERLLIDNGLVRTIAMSKDYRYIAFTSIHKDSYIYIMNMQTEEIQQVELKIPQPDAPEDAVLNYADVLTFNFRGDHLIFDAVSDLKLASGETYTGWGIYSLRLADLSMNIVMQQSPGLQIGNPTFAHTSDHLLVADLELTQGNQRSYNIVILDFDKSEIGVIHSQLALLGRPSYRGDDRKVVFTTVDQTGTNFMMLESALATDQMTLEPDSTNLLVSHTTPLSFPVGFRVGEFVPQKGEITVPASLAFGEESVGSSVQKDVRIQNSGNGDLQILDITIEGTNADSFTHNGINREIPAGKEMTFQVTFVPRQAGTLNAVLRVRSTDMDKTEVSVNLSGTGVGSAEPTIPPPTEIPTLLPPTVIQPTNTPTPVQQPTQPPVPDQTPVIPSPIQPSIVYEFDQATLAENGWSVIPGGFTGAEAGSIDSTAFFGNPIPSSVDDKGLSITVQPGQVAFIYAAAPIDTGGKPILLRLTARSDGANAAIAVAALKGSLAATDTSIATHIPATAASFVDEARTLVLLYEPDTGHLVTPIIQVAATGQEGSVNVLVDRLEAYVIDMESAYTGRILFSASQ